jgi:hypothetical protein
MTSTLAERPKDALETKALSISAAPEDVDKDKGILTAFVSVTGVADRVGDIIVPGAYEKTLLTRKPKGILDHDWKRPCSKVLDIKELLPGDPELPDTQANGEPWPAAAGALRVKAQYNLASEEGKNAYANALFFEGDMEFSIGYNVPPGGSTMDSKTGIRSITNLELFEFSQVLWGAAPLSRLQSVKSLDGAEGDVVEEKAAITDASSLKAAIAAAKDDAAKNSVMSAAKKLKLTFLVPKKWWSKADELAVDAFKSLGLYLNEIGMFDPEEKSLFGFEDDVDPEEEATDYKSLVQAIEDQPWFDAKAMPTIHSSLVALDLALEAKNLADIDSTQETAVTEIKALLESDPAAFDSIRDVAGVMAEMVEKVLDGIETDTTEEVQKKDDVATPEVKTDTAPEMVTFSLADFDLAGLRSEL